MTVKTRTPEREQFLADLLCGAIEHCGYGFPGVAEWHCPDGRPGEWYALIVDRYDEDDNTVHRVDLDTMAKGLGIIRRAFVATDGVPTKYQPSGSGDAIYVHPTTWERLYLGSELRSDLLECDRSNGDEGDYDVIGALAVLECAMFGSVTYA